MGRRRGRSGRHLLLHVIARAGVNMSKQAILLVEDDEDDALLTTRALRKINLANEIVVVNDGALALDYLFATGDYADRDARELPEIVLLDLKLRQINGLEVLRRMREDKRTRLLPVIILTSSEEERDIAECYKHGASSVVRKPVDLPRFAGMSALRLLRQRDSDIPCIFVSGTIGEDTAVMAMRAGAQDYIMKGRSKRLLPAVERELQEAEARRERRRTEQDHARLVATLEATTDFVATTNAQGMLLYLNGAGRTMLGIDATDDISQVSLYQLSPAWSANFLRDALSIAHRDGVWSGECTLLARNGTEILVSQLIQAHHDANGAVEFYSAIARDMSERKRFEEELRHLATHDSLTGLPNRVLLHDRLESALLTAQRQQIAVAVLFLDLDNFKRINDTLGHTAGDSLLRQVAERLRARLRTTDTGGRRGGDEFMVIFNHPFDVKEVTTVVNKVRSAFAQPFICEGEELFVTATLGIALYPEDGQSAEVLVKNADVAMYRAKEKGKDQYQFYIAEMSAESRAQLTMEMELRRALERSEFTLHYQPQFNVRSGRPVGFEALIRWQHPRQGLLSPDQFMPLLEESGLIVSVGEWVLRSACAQRREWCANGLRDLRGAINVSARQFGSNDFVDLVRQVIAEEQVPPSCIELEVTETVVMQDVLRAAEILP